jgi:hypothetical protein
MGFSVYIQDANNWGDNFLWAIGEDNVIRVDGVRDMCDKIKHLWNSMPGNIASLSIDGHGSPGFQAVGAGTDGDNTGEKALFVNPDIPQLLWGPASTLFLNMRDMFENDAVVSLIGCQVAKGEKGLQLLRAVSFALNVSVQGGEKDQRLLPGWEGDVYRCYRNTCWISRYSF